MAASWLTVLSVSWHSAGLLRDLFAGMMALADRVARLQLADLLHTLGFTEVEIVFQDG